jgi:hypothetical protein
MNYFIVLIPSVLIFIVFIVVFLYLVTKNNTSHNVNQQQNNQILGNSNQNILPPPSNINAIQPKKNQKNLTFNNIKQRNVTANDDFVKGDITIYGQTIGYSESVFTEDSEFDVDTDSSISNYNMDGTKTPYTTTSMTGFSNVVVITNKDGSVYLEDNSNITTIESDIECEKIILFNKQLLCLSKDQYIYYLPNDFFGKTKWIWNKLEIQSPKNNNIYYICSTINGKYLWIQNYNNGYLLDSDLNKICTTKMDRNLIRIYGKSKDKYITLNIKECTLLQCGERKKQYGIKAAVLDINGKIKTINKDNKHKYNGLYVINGNYYYDCK